MNITMYGDRSTTWQEYATPQRECLATVWRFLEIQDNGRRLSGDEVCDKGGSRENVLRLNRCQDAFPYKKLHPDSDLIHSLFGK